MRLQRVWWALAKNSVTHLKFIGLGVIDMKGFATPGFSILGRGLVRRKEHFVQLSASTV